MNVADLGTGVVKRAGLRIVLQEHGPSHPAIRVGYMGTDAPDVPDPQVFPP